MTKRWEVTQMSGLDDFGAPQYAVWLTEIDPEDGPKSIRILGRVTFEYLEGFFAGLENAECYGPFSSEDVRDLRRAIYEGTGVRV